jgi:hypothetical protein
MPSRLDAATLDAAMEEINKVALVPAFSLGKPPSISGDKAREVMFGEMRILFSYADPIAFKRRDIVRLDNFSKRHSNTTARHRNAWIKDEDDVEILSHAEFQRQLAANVMVELGAERNTLYDVVGESSRFVNVFADLVRRLRRVCVAAEKLDTAFARELTGILTDALAAMMNIKKGD